jgi:Na+(H+)/acetate symporter ActP
LVFAFYQFNTPPLFFNQTAVDDVKKSSYAGQFAALEKKHADIQAGKRSHVLALTDAVKRDDQAAIQKSRTVLADIETSVKDVRKEATTLISTATGSEVNDVNYIFLRFVIDYLPRGMIGLLIAVILLASMGSLASAYNSLASCSVVDIYKRMYRKDSSTRDYVGASRWATFFWGIFCIFVAQYASRLGSMIEAVNVLGSLFYGVILGIFLVAFYFKSIGGRAVFWGTVIGEIFVVISYWKDLTAFLWLNLIGCVLVIIFAAVIEKIWPENKTNELEPTN